MRRLAVAVTVAAVGVGLAAPARAQKVAGPEKARAVAGDPGISSMVVLDRPEFRILRDYAEPGATRRMHSHDDATYHVFVLITGQLRLTIDGEGVTTLHRIVVDLLDERTARWSREQAEAMALHLAPDNPTLTDIAPRLGISPQAVN